MKKSELLKLPVMKPTKEMIECAKMREMYKFYNKASKEGPRYGKLYRAKKQGNVLEVDAFWYKDLLYGAKTPRYRIFLHEGKHDTYDCGCEKWRTATIENLNFMEGWNQVEYRALSKYWIPEKDRKIIEKFTDNGEKTVDAMIQRWQQHEKNRKEIDRIDDEMSVIPDIPKDFEDWIKKDAVPQYMFYESGKNIGLCTCCGAYQKLEKPRYGKTGRCPKCKREVTYRTYKKSGRIVDRAGAALIQKTKRGFVFRFFKTIQEIKQGKRTGFNAWEYIRIIYDENWRKRGTYHLGRYKQTSMIRWCDGYERNACYYYGLKEEEKAALYPRNLKRILKGSRLEYSGLPEFAKTRRWFYQASYIERALEYPGVEKLTKAGFYNLAESAINNGNHSPMELGETKVKKVLDLKGEYYNLIKNKDISWREYEKVWECQDAGVWATWEQIQEMSKIYRNFAIYMKYSTPHKMLRYIRENVESSKKWDTAEEAVDYTDYHDYLQMAAGLGYNLRDPWILYPKNLKERHDQFVEEKREREEELAKKKDDEKDADFRKTIQKNGWENYEMETEDFFIRLPKRVREIRQEGQNQHHCVATYIDRMVSGKTCILFIRKKEEPEESYYTVEVREGEVIQVRGKYNKDPGEDVKKFMNTFKKRIQMRKAG